MRAPILASCLVLLLVIEARTQGRFAFANPTAPTHIGSIDGPLAGPEIWATMFAGPTPTNLVALARSFSHYTNGIVAGGGVAVPGMLQGSVAYVQMVAWDSRLWGTAFSAVPTDQLGRTDIVPAPLTEGARPLYTPLFTQSAIVPIPEPAVAMLMVAGAGVVAGYRRLRRLRARVRGDT